MTSTKKNAKTFVHLILNNESFISTVISENTVYCLSLNVGIYDNLVETQHTKRLSDIEPKLNFSLFFISRPTSLGYLYHLQIRFT